ncbi:hypothetical protein M9H77_06300 [Catharanthus roseus]|uniref:Uncharacterized protein n=1 Tax=Catharanthus roseus TaxID=4058 RepID=A0ACC0BRN4_CATRO|nr:hypothetical protein M9H77_06300 [Catharanthus roseus]
MKKCVIYGLFHLTTRRKGFIFSLTSSRSTVAHMVSDEPFMLYTTVNNDDDEVDESDGDDVVSSQSESDDDNDPEEGELQTPLNPVNLVNPVTENIVP